MEWVSVDVHELNLRVELLTKIYRSPVVIPLELLIVCLNQLVLTVDCVSEWLVAVSADHVGAILLRRDATVEDARSQSVLVSNKLLKVVSIVADSSSFI